jgi:putative nucleotidyltransferase with HDIG domain
MKEVRSIDLEPGMVTAKDVLTQKGQKIFDAGTELTPQQIIKLTFYQVTSVFVEGEETDEERAKREKPVDKDSNQAYSLKVRSSSEFQAFQIDHSRVISIIKESFDAFVNDGTPLDSEKLLKSVAELYNTCHTSLELFDMLNNMRSSNDSVYNHSLNVSLICRRFARWLKYDVNRQNTLTLCGLYHDIGKLKIPDEILNKPGRYTDEEFALVKRHPEFGYELLKDLPFDDCIKKAALSHHERCDGTGYPKGIREADTDDAAMIVAIADVYDAMTAARSYRAPLCPFEVIANFEHEGLQKYKPQFILTFLSHVASTYRNNRILLSNGKSGRIVMLNDKYLSRPIVQLNDGSCIDLSTQPSELHIKAIV